MAAEPSRDTDRQSDLAVMDANEYKQKRRLERILDAMDKIEEQANKAWEGFVQGEISHDAKNIMIQRAVKEAVRESYNLLLEHQHSAEESEKDRTRYWINTTAQPLGKVELKEDTIWIRDLRDFLESRELYREEWVETVKPRNKPERDEERVQERTVPESVSWEAALRLKEFLSREHDLEIQFEELDNQIPSWGFEEVHRDEDE